MHAATGTSQMNKKLEIVGYFMLDFNFKMTNHILKLHTTTFTHEVDLYLPNKNLVVMQT